MRCINLVDSVERINYGVWHAAIINASLMKEQEITTELWYPAADLQKLADVDTLALHDLSFKSLDRLMVDKKLDPLHDIIITHGSWKYATRWGARLRKKGFTWIYVPQGMLEPWSMQQKKWKKRIYFYLMEKRLVAKADYIRAVSAPESVNLSRMFNASKIRFIPNGVEVNELPVRTSSDTIRRYLFLSRLHHKKNILALAEAWMASRMNNQPDAELMIAGPDQGELPRLLKQIESSQNIRYIGSVYGKEKQQLMDCCTFYVLPSFSEGLPSSLLEAMSAGLIPLITEGCNLPEAFENGGAVKIETDAFSIGAALEKTYQWDEERITATRMASWNFVKNSFSLSATSQQLISLLKEKHAN